MKIRRGRLLGIIGIAAAFAVPAGAVETSFDIDAGYRTDRLRWNIAADPSGTATPNILSELTWKKLRIAQLGLGWRLTAASGLHVRAAGAYGAIFNGRNQDSDYLGNNRTFEFSRSNSATRGDDVWNLAAAVGYRFAAAHDSVNHITPLFGLSQEAQNLRITDGHQTVPPLGPFPNLNSTYRAQWRGYWLGLELDSTGRQALRTFLRLEYHVSDYTAEANWNLRDDLAHPKSFEHQASGRGFVAAVGVQRTPARGRWAGTFGLEYRRKKTDPGTDTVFGADGTTDATRLNEVVWKSWSIFAGLQYRF